MKTSWTAPGKGATIQELVALFGRTGKNTHADYLSKRGYLRTNLAITEDGIVERNDYDRFDVAEATYYFP